MMMQNSIKSLIRFHFQYCLEFNGNNCVVVGVVLRQIKIFSLFVQGYIKIIIIIKELQLLNELNKWDSIDLHENITWTKRNINIENQLLIINDS